MTVYQINVMLVLFEIKPLWYLNVLINLHIIGVQKAGTTALANFIQQHPDIYVLDGKEAHIFDHPNFPELEKANGFIRRHVGRKLAQYKQQKIICDATPITLFNQRFLENCYHHNPSAKFIVMLRDPTERAISHYHMSCGNGQETRCMLMAFLLESRRLKKINAIYPAFDSPYRTQSYLRRGLYSKQLQAMFSLITKEQILVIHQQQLKNQHSELLNTVFDFIGVKHCQIAAQTVFATQKIHSHWSDPLAKLYAKCYFMLAGETTSRLAKWLSPLKAKC